MDGHAPGEGGSASDPWFYRYDPGEVAAAADQVSPETTFLQDFRSKLLSREDLPAGPGLFADKLLRPLQELTCPDARPSWPLSVFNQAKTRPTQNELQAMKMTYFTEFSRRCPFLKDVPSETLEAHCELLSLAIVSLGSCLSRVTDHTALVKYANQTLIATLGMPNNRATRDPRTFIAWLLNETAAVMGSDAVLWREANFAHGCVETAIRRWWKVCGERRFRAQRGSDYISSIPAYSLLIDLVRALHLGVVPSSASALCNIPVDKNGLTIKSLRATTFCQNSYAVSKGIENNPLLTILIVLDQVIAWAAISPTVERSRSDSGKDLNTMLSLTMKEECNRCRRKIERALKAWSNTHFTASLPEVKTIYYFCQLHLLVPKLQPLVLEARYKPRITPEVHESESDNPVKQVCYDTTTTNHALHFAWLLLESVAETQDKTYVWLPITTFISALCVWKGLKHQGDSRVHGSIRVLEIFNTELEKMPWPCCRSMIECLSGLS